VVLVVVAIIVGPGLLFLSALGGIVHL
jgi:hypothetical protein